MSFTPRRRKAKIIATLGPSSQPAKSLKAVFEAGADIFRLNMSHGDHGGKAEAIQTIRELERKTGRPLTILADLQGPKLRIGTFADGPIELKTGASFALDAKDEPGTKARVFLPHPEIFAAVEKNQRLLLDDGKIQLRVTSASKTKLSCKVIQGGKLSDRKGVNIPDAILPLAALTMKDRVDLEFALEQNVDWVALSFVQRPEDVAEARKLVSGRAGILSKIEKPSAIQHLDEIIELSDAVMVARGDLGVELPPAEVPALQKVIVTKARAAGKPVVVATQMLESMIQSPTPTRAEVSDVANAIYEGADAVMLSAESAVGDFPVEAVAMMDEIAALVEGDDHYERFISAGHQDPQATTEDAISNAARHVARTIGARLIVTFTFSGSTAHRAARERPSVPILALTPRLETARRLGLYWGLHCVRTRDVKSFEEMVGKAKRMALRTGLAGRGDRIVITAGVPFGTPGSTNVLKITFLQGDELDDRSAEVRFHA